MAAWRKASSRIRVQLLAATTRSSGSSRSDFHLARGAWTDVGSFAGPRPKFSTAGLGNSGRKRGPWTRTAGTAETVFLGNPPADL